MANPNKPSHIFFPLEGEGSLLAPDYISILPRRCAFRRLCQALSREGGCAARSRSLLSVGFLPSGPL